MGLKTIFVLLCFWLALVSTQQYNSTVNLANFGTIRGSEITYGNVTVNQFAGIPYAAPPVGELRFQYPQPAPAVPGVFDATRFGNICPQVLNGQFQFPNQNLSEDCLTLNVWAPNTAGLKPVLFWIHAGSFLQGSGSEFRYHGQNLAAQENIIVVTINYRLGAFGTLAHPSLEATYNNSGSYTLADQYFALRWVLDNIDSFGGDITRITVGGISAGGSATIYLLSNDMINSEISQAIVQSANTYSQVQTKANGLIQGVEVAGLLSCNGTDAQTIACLRNVSFNQYITLAPYAAVAKASIDGVYLSGEPYNLVSQQIVRNVPTLFGNTLNESTLFIFGSQVTPLAQPAYPPFVNNQVRSFIAPTINVDTAYPCASYNPADCRVAASEAISDSLFFCQGTSFGDRYANYGYIFSYVPSYVPAEQGSPHLADIPYHFNSLNLTLFNYTQADLALAQIVSRYFGSFITSGNPNYPGAAVAFPDYIDNNGNTVFMVYGPPAFNTTNFKRSNGSECAKWEQVYRFLASGNDAINLTPAGIAPPPAASNAPVASPSASPSISSGPVVSPTATTIPSQSPCPVCPTASACPSCAPAASGSFSPSCPVPSPCPTCPSSGSGTTNINFFFADMLNGVKATGSSS